MILEVSEYMEVSGSDIISLSLTPGTILNTYPVKLFSKSIDNLNTAPEYSL